MNVVINHVSNSVLYSGVLFLIRGIGIKCQKEWLYTEAVMVSIVFTVMNAICFFKDFDTTKLIIPSIATPLQLQQFNAELAYYFTYGVLEFISKSHTMAVHHLLSILAILLSFIHGYHHFSTGFLFIFSCSNIPLALAKARRHMYRKGEKMFQYTKIYIIILKA